MDIITDDITIEFKSEIVSYPRVVDDMDMDAFQRYLTILRRADAKHDFRSSIEPQHIIKTIPDLDNINKNERNSPTALSEEKILQDYVTGSSYVSGKYNVIRSEYYLSNEDDLNLNSFYSDDKFGEYTNKGLSNIEKALDKIPAQADIFLHVDTSYKGFKRDISYIDKYKLYWVNTKTQKYDPAGKTHPGTDVGKEMCGWGKAKNKNLFYAWENTAPGIKQNLFYPKWERGTYKVLESYVFTPYNIFMQTTNDDDTDDYMKHESNIVIYDTNTKKYVYANKTLSNKNGTNIQDYTKLIKDNFESIKSLISSYFSGQITKNALPFDDSSLVISKFMGDASQYLFAGLSGIKYRYNTNQGPDKIDNVTSGRYNAFVSIDRVAIVGAINAGVPIVIHDKNKSFDMYILKEIQNVSTDTINPVEELQLRIENLNSQIRQLKGEFDELKTKIEKAQVDIDEYNRNKSGIIEYFRKLSGELFNGSDTEPNTADEEYKNLIKVMCLLIVPFNFSNKVTTSDYNIEVPTEFNTDIIRLNDNINSLFKTDKESTDINPFDIESTDINLLIKEVEQEIAKEKIKYKELSQKIENIERIKAVNSYFKAIPSTLYNDTPDKREFIFDFTSLKQPVKIFKSINYLLSDVKPFSTIESGDVSFSNRIKDDKLLPKAVRIFMTTQLVDFLHSLDSDLGSTTIDGQKPITGVKTVKTHVLTILNNLFNKIISNCSDKPKYKELVIGHVKYLKVNTPLKDLDDSTHITVGGNPNKFVEFNELDENLLKAITLIYILNKKYTNGSNIPSENASYIRSIQSISVNLSDYFPLPTNRGIVHEFELDIISFPIDMIFNYLDDLVTMGYITTLAQKLNMPNMSGSDVYTTPVKDNSIKTYLLSLYDELHIYTDNTTPTKKPIDNKINQIFGYVDSTLIVSQTGQKRKPIYQLTSSSSKYFRKPDELTRISLRAPFGRSPQYKRNPASWPSATPPDFSIFPGGNQTKNERTTQTKNPNNTCNQKRTKRFLKKNKILNKNGKNNSQQNSNKPYNQKRTKRFVKKMKYQTLKKQRHLKP